MSRKAVLDADGDLKIQMVKVSSIEHTVPLRKVSKCEKRGTNVAGLISETNTRYKKIPVAEKQSASQNIDGDRR